MATIADKSFGTPEAGRSAAGIAGAIDRWIYVFTAASFIAITLTGFIPDSAAKIAAVQAGQRAPFPIVLHMHAVLMGAFLLLLLAQTILVATGRLDRHRILGRAAMVLVPAIVVVGFILIPTIYQSVWNAAAAAPPQARAPLQALILRLDVIMLLQLRVGILFPLFLFIGLKARGADSGLHKRMMILATAVPLAAGIDRIEWLPTTFPASPLATDLYVLLAVSPLLIWDVVRNRRLHRAWLIWIGASLPLTVPMYMLWGTPFWQSLAPRLMGV
jgi:hypothetical protein